MRTGFTLIEVLVVLGLLGMVLGLSGIALASLDRGAKSEAVAKLSRARADAIKTGRPVHVDGFLFLRDGSARGAGVDLLTGALHEAP